MIRSTTMIITPLLLTGLLLTGSTTNAAIATQTYNVTLPQPISGPISGILQEPTPVVSILLPFDRFDTSLGTLDSVDWDYQLDFELSATVGTGGGGLSGGVSGSFYLDPLKEAGLGSFDGNGNGNGNGGPAGPISVSFSVLNSNSYTSGLIGPNFNFFSAPGGGAHVIEYEVSDGSLDASGNANDATITLTGGFSTLTFNYTAVPEPSSLLLLSLVSTGALGVCRRR